MYILNDMPLFDRNYGSHVPLFDRHDPITLPTIYGWILTLIFTFVFTNISVFLYKKIKK